MEYRRRMADHQLEDNLDAFGAVVIEGPKGCGKTTTAQQVAASVIKLQDPDNYEAYRATAQSRPSMLLKGNNPRLIDEWQDFPVIWDAVRNAVDANDEVGLFILTSSKAFSPELVRHSGSSRIEVMKMSTMSLYESGESNGKISLSELFANPELNIEGIQSDVTVEDLIYAVCRGGWPATFKCRTDNARLKIAYNSFKSTCERDVSQFDGVKRKPEIARAILCSYARNISTFAKKSSMIEDVKGMLGSMTEPTFDDYAEVLRRLYVIDDIYGWCPSIRSASSMRSGPKREFVDPSIAIAALGLSPASFQYDLKTFGFFFENLCVRDLKAYTQSEDAKVSYYHDRNGLEADIVLHLKDGRYALIECKLGSQEIEDGANHLVELRRLIVENNKNETQAPLREPDLLIVLTGGNIAYTRKDGVRVIPLACLKW
jgi:hypothetical protein